VPNPVLTHALDAVASGRDLPADEAAAVLDEIMHGRADQTEVAGFLIGLRAKGETVEEITGLARTMRALAAPVTTRVDGLLDVVGTGGGATTFNVSTTAALIAAGAGCTVAKHGNRSATSRCGSADVLEALGARIDLPADAVGPIIDDVGFGFMFAPTHHAATRHVVPVRKALGVRTVFNVLGPLTNPAGAQRQLTGVSDRRFLSPLAQALAALGAERALVVHSDDGLDELSIAAPTSAVELRDGRLRELRIDPREHGFVPAPMSDVAGAGPEHNAATTRAVLAGEPGAARDVAVLNAGAAIHVAGRAPTIGAGIEAATAAVDDGSAARVLERFIAATKAPVAAEPAA
jgi:anthranilate phosphoribosyltransferase